MFMLWAALIFLAFVLIVMYIDYCNAKKQKQT
jgi:hypothetical protein